ncbi:MAG: hypothetical protein KC561_17485 [Myxococcales bacterium]|nr:hypothetical protein [Myxococcales bacterium]
MRSEIGRLDLDDTFSERDQINENIVREIDKASEPWGVKVTRYEIMNITPSARVIDTMEKQMEAERQKRAQITLSAGKKEAHIQLSQGERQEAINLSEGQKQRRINEASGRAEAIRIVADATAQGIELVADALRQPGGSDAMRMQLVEQFIAEIDSVIRGGARVTVVPEQVANIKAMVEGVTQVTKQIGSSEGGAA